MCTEHQQHRHQHHQHGAVGFLFFSVFLFCLSWAQHTVYLRVALHAHNHTHTHSLSPHSLTHTLSLSLSLSLLFVQSPFLMNGVVGRRTTFVVDERHPNQNKPGEARKPAQEKQRRKEAQRRQGDNKQGMGINDDLPLHFELLKIPQIIVCRAFHLPVPKSAS